MQVERYSTIVCKLLKKAFFDSLDCQSNNLEKIISEL